MKVLTAQEAAETLRMSLWSVHHELKAGRLRGSKPKGRWLIPESAIEEYLQQHSNEPVEVKSRRRRRRKW